jgi:hypothetical protein
MKSGVTPGVLFFLGGVLGVLVVRGFFLDHLEELGWRMFWDGVANGRVMDLGRVFGSATFMKCLVGFVVCGGAAYAVGKAKLSKDPGSSST